MSQITSHILDLGSGVPATGVLVTLFRGSGNGREQLASAETDGDGRISGWLQPGSLEGGIYSMVFDSGTYFQRQGIETFYPHVEIVFRIKPGGQHYHVPLLLSPWGYSTYRGS